MENTILHKYRCPANLMPTARSLPCVLLFAVACRVDWRLEKDRYLRLKHLINRKVGQLLKLQKLAKSGAAASRCSLYHGAC